MHNIIHKDIDLSTFFLNCVLLLLRLLNDNLLEGEVPEELYSVGVHGGTIE